MHLLVACSILQSQREREIRSHKMNCVTFNYKCIYVFIYAFICDAHHSSVRGAMNCVTFNYTGVNLFVMPETDRQTETESCVMYHITFKYTCINYAQHSSTTERERKKAGHKKTSHI